VPPHIVDEFLKWFAAQSRPQAQSGIYTMLMSIPFSNIFVFANIQVMAADLGASTSSPVSTQGSLEMSNSIDPKLPSIPFKSVIPDTTPTLSYDGPSQYPSNSRNLEATDSNFDLPTSHRVPPSKNPHPTTEKDQLDANPRVNLNRAMGVEPTDRRSVQARRKEVSTYCLMHYGFTLDTPYTQWSPVTWRQLVNAVYKEFRQRYAWTRDTCEEVMKSICSDTSRNIRSSLRQAAKNSNSELPPVHHQKHKASPQTKTILRKAHTSKLVICANQDSGDNAVLDDELYSLPDRLPISTTTPDNPTISTTPPPPADNSPIRIPPRRDSHSVAPDTVNNHHTTSQHISASRHDLLSTVHDTSRPDCILPENFNDAPPAVVRSPSDREGIKETTHSSVRHFRSDVQRLTVMQSQSPIEFTPRRRERRLLLVQHVARGLLTPV
jgi:hypothetical protein